MLRTLRSRLLAAAFATFASMLVLLQWNALRLMQVSLDRSLAAQAEIARPLVAGATAPLLAARDHATLQELVDRAVVDNGLVALEVRDSGGGPVAAAGRFSGDERIVVPLEIAGQSVGSATLQLDSAAAAAARHALLRDGLAIGAAVLAGGMALLAVAMAVVTTGAQRLVGAARRIARGELDVQVPSEGAWEIREVAEAFNRMSLALQERLGALRASETRLRSTVAALSEGLVVHDGQGRIVECNEAAERLLGLPPRGAAGTTLDALPFAVREPDGRPLPPEERPVRTTLRSGRPQRDRLVEVERADGSRLWVHINAEPIHAADGQTLEAVVVTISDVDRHVRAEELLRAANQTLEQRVAERTAELSLAKEVAEGASRAKSDFLSRMSHELRTPLNAILGFAQLLALDRRRLESGQLEQLRRIEAAGWHLLGLIDEVLDLSRIEAGAMPVSAEPVELHEIAAEALAMVATQAAQQQVQLDGLPPGTGPLWVRADRRRLLQVLGNLLSNAVKYNRSGGRAWMEAARLDDGRVRFTVADTGRGVTEAQRAQLFVPFSRIDDGGRTQGTGIGLVITRRLVELMGGGIELRDAPGGGAAFEVTLPGSAAPAPLAAPAPEMLAALPPAPTRPVRLLLVEDNPSNVALVADALALRPGLALTTAGDGPSGWQRLRTERPDLAIVDIDLPGFDGNELCRRAKAEPGLAAIPLLALTAQAMPDDRVRMRAAGFDAVMTKPLDIARLFAEIERLLQRRP